MANDAMKWLGQIWLRPGFPAGCKLLPPEITGGLWGRYSQTSTAGHRSSSERRTDGDGFLYAAVRAVVSFGNLVTY